jgi:hypothetical protein
MMMKFEVDRFSLHFIDTKNKKSISPKSEKETMLDSLEKSDKDKIANFFGRHLSQVWDKGESGSAVNSANFQEDALVSKLYQEIIEDGKKYFKNSNAIAKHLYDISPSTANPGVLIILLFHKEGIDKHFLGLLKMDPSQEDKMTLSSEAEDFPLKIMVKIIDRALPEPGDKVQKWAILPNPIRDMGVLFRDNTSTSDPAEYLKKFLGCIAEPKEGPVIKGVYKVIDSISKEKGIEPIGAVNSITNKAIEKGENVTIQGLADLMEEIKIFSNFDKSDFENKMKKEAKVEEFNIPPDKFRKTMMKFELPGEITIKAPLSAYNNSLKIINENNIVKFTIETTPDFKVKYVNK